MQEIRISLHEDGFKMLVSGEKIITGEGYVRIEICLQDIGFDRMRKIINNADPRN